MNVKKRKITKRKKKFFILVACYLAIFVITSFVTLATLSWFSGGTWANNTVFMGGPVYIKFVDDKGNTTSGENKLKLVLPEKWDLLYPGMNIQINANAVLQGAKWEKEKVNGDKVTIYTTGAIMRAKVMLTVIDPQGNTNTQITNDIYEWVWSQLMDPNNIGSNEDKGTWIFDKDSPADFVKYFYFTTNSQPSSHSNSGNYSLKDLGGNDQNVSVGFLHKAIITLPGEPLTNKHAECKLKFTIVFQALQAFLPYTEKEIGKDKKLFDSSATGLVKKEDVGMAKPLTISNSREYFKEAFAPLYPDKPDEGVIL